MTDRNDTPANISVVCPHCDQPMSLTRPDIKLRPSPIPETLGCKGLVPLEVAAVNDTMSVTLSDISELDREIARFQAATKELQSKRTSLQFFVNDHINLLNPITRLPTELFSQIFQHCVIVPWLGEALPTYIGSHLDTTPLKIASVSRQWRNAALNTPQLWSSFSLLLFPDRTSSYIESANIWLSRSRNSPLSIHLVTHDNYRDPMQQLMQLIASTCGRWRHICFKLTLPMLHSLSSIRFGLSMLETLKFEFFDREGLSMDSPIDLFVRAPRLREFSAGQFVDHTSLSLPFNQLRDIKPVYYKHNIQNSLNLLKLASNVEHYELRLNGRSPGMAPSSIQSIIEIPKLQSLTAVFDWGFDGGAPVGPAQFFAFLHTPNIRALSLAIDARSWKTTKRHVSFLCSQPLLVKLALNTCRYREMNDASEKLTDQDMIEILNAAKQLRELDIPESGTTFISEDFVKSFARLDSSGTPILSPNLQTLLFRHSKHINFENLAQALIVRSLCSPGNHAVLTTVTILCAKSKMVSVLETFRVSAWWDQLQDLGIELQVMDLEAYAVWW